MGMLSFILDILSKPRVKRIRPHIVKRKRGVLYADGIEMGRKYYEGGKIVLSRSSFKAYVGNKIIKGPRRSLRKRPKIPGFPGDIDWDDDVYVICGRVLILNKRKIKKGRKRNRRKKGRRR